MAPSVDMTMCLKSMESLETRIYLLPLRGGQSRAIGIVMVVMFEVSLGQP